MAKAERVLMTREILVVACVEGAWNEWAQGRTGRARATREARGGSLSLRVSPSRASFFLASITFSRLFKYQVTTEIKYCKVKSTLLQENRLYNVRPTLDCQQHFLSGSKRGDAKFLQVLFG